MSQDIMRVENFLAHYASEFYDPVKAHEYYLKNRELSGRQTTKGMSDDQREGWTYAKSQISERQKADIQSAAEQRKAFVDQARDSAQKVREQISEQLHSVLQQISDKRTVEAEAITKGQQADLEKLAAEQAAKSAEIREAAAQKIAALPPIPKGVSDEQRAQLVARRAAKIAEINGTAWNDLVSLAAKNEADHDAILVGAKSKRAALSEATAIDREKVRNSVTSSREALSQGLKAVVGKARTDYEARKEQIKADYEAAAQREYDGLRTNLPSAPVSTRKTPAKKEVAKTSKPGVRSMTLEEAAVAAVKR
jgi:hypothetical protein